MKIYTRECNTCGKKYTGYGKFYCSSKCQPRHKLSEEAKKKLSGKNHYAWKDNRASYQAFHIWLRMNYGNANKCENPNCQYKNPKRFEWALIHGKKHNHKRENYWQLCKSCHTKYDEINKGEKSCKWKGGKPKCINCGKTLSTYKNKTSLCALCNRRINPPWLGKKRSEETRKKISESHKKRYAII